MFIEHEVELGHPAFEVERRLMATLTEVEGLGSAAYRRGEELRSRVGPTEPFAKEVVVAVGRAHLSRSGLVLPVTWRATGAQALFPRLQGELTVTDRRDSTSALAFRASYQPPFGWLGTVVDRFLLARFARLTIVDWLERIAATIEGASPEMATVTGSPGPDTIGHAEDTGR